MTRSHCLIVGLLASCAASPPRAATKTSAPAAAPAFQLIELPGRGSTPPRPAFACNPARVAPVSRYDGLAQTQITKRICPEPFPITKSRPTKTDRDNCLERALNGELGSWALQVTLAPKPGAPATWRLVYLTKERQLLKSAPEHGLVIMDYPQAPTDPVDVPRLTALFDFDGDGRSEAVTETRHGIGSKSFKLVRVWTAKGNAVTPFGDTATRRLVDIIDSNQDRYPDFFLDPYGLPFDGAAAFIGPQAPWAMAVELRPNGQVLEDGLQTELQARAQCPSAAGLRETLLSTRGPCVPLYLHCAKLWATPEQEVEAALDAFCETERYDADPYCATHRATWSQMSHVRLPLHLTESTGGVP